MEGRSISGESELVRKHRALEAGHPLLPRVLWARVELTDAGCQVMEDVLREERVFQPPEVKLQDTCDGVHVMVILVTSQGVFSWE